MASIAYRTPRLPWLLSLLLLSPCSLMSGVQAREVPITILHTTDLHGHIHPVTDYEGRENVGGLLRLATAIERERERTPNALLFDCGDFIQGSAETFLTQGEVTIRAIDFLEFDGVVVGNHEFDWGPKYLTGLGRDFPRPLLGANIRRRTEANFQTRLEAPDWPAMKPWVVHEVDGVRVVIVGLTTPGMPLWFRPELLGDIEVESPVDCLRRIMPTVRELEPEVLVLVTHMGYFPMLSDRQKLVNHIHLVTREFPDFDLILGGHTHRPVDRLDLRDTTYAQAGYFGAWLGRVDLVFDTVKDRVTSKRSVLLDVGPDIPKHDGLEHALTNLLTKTSAQLKEVIGETEIDLHPRTRRDGTSPVQQLFCAAIAEEVGCELVLHGTLDDRASIPVGPITLDDLFRIVPYENRIGVARLTPPDIRKILEENARGRGGSRRFMSLRGLRYTYDPEKPAGKQIVDLRLADGTALHGRKRYPVGFNSFVLASAGGRYRVLREVVDQPEARLTLFDIQTRDAVRRFIEARTPLTGETLQ